MNYISQMNAFWDWRRLHELNSKQADLYFALLDCANSCGWKSPFTAPNTTLQSMCRMSKAELYKHRNVLLQMGLIGYEKGRKGSAGKYRLPLLYKTYTPTDGGTDGDPDAAADGGAKMKTIPKIKENKNKNNPAPADKHPAEVKSGPAQKKDSRRDQSLEIYEKY
jgi:hypothetical protein